jgi:pyruvate, water dikinase
LAAGRVAWFTDPHCADRSITGGKGASLARLAMAGLPVPEGFVVTSQALTADAAVEPTLAAEVSDAYSLLGAGPVAVRSSACAEDSDNASFAGQHETYLNVRGEAEVVAAVGRCWASVFSERAVFYRDRKGSPDDVRMAVVIQRQLNPAKSGVMFTMDPVQRRRDRMVVEAVWGLGEAVVSGRVTPDHYVIDRTGIALRMHISLQPLLIESLETGGTVERPLAPQIGGARVLTDEDLIALADIGHRLEAIFGGPQDVEWAIQDGQLYLLQSRPVTA